MNGLTPTPAQYARNPQTGLMELTQAEGWSYGGNAVTDAQAQAIQSGQPVPVGVASPSAPHAQAFGYESTYTPTAFSGGGGGVSPSAYQSSANPTAYQSGYTPQQWGGSFNAGTFSGDDAPELESFEFNYKESDGYKFLLGEAMEAVTNQFAARGLGSSGAEAKALQDRAAGLAATDVNNQFNRAMSKHQQNTSQQMWTDESNFNRDATAFQMNSDNAYKSASLDLTAFGQYQSAQVQSEQIKAAAHNAYQSNLLAKDQINATSWNQYQNNLLTADQNQFNQNYQTWSANEAQSRYYDQTGYDRSRQNWVDNMTSTQMDFNNNLSLAQIGMGATNAMGNATQANAQAVGNGLVAQGNNLATGILGSANAQASGTMNFLDAAYTGAKIYTGG